MDYIQNLTVKNLRCFADFTLDFTANVVLIKGANGSGKTTILEALAYASNLRSFRTHHINDLIAFAHNSFFIKVDVAPAHTLKTAFDGKKRVIKFDDKTIKSHKEIQDLYHAVSLTEDDLSLVQDGPEVRRTFLDHILLVIDSGYGQLLRDYRKIVDQRTALLQNYNGFNLDHYNLWTNELLKKSNLIAESRQNLLQKLNKQANLLLDSFINPLVNKDYKLDLVYNPKKVNNLMDQEKRTGRTLIGAHLDDILINLQDKKSRSFASRGQQKLLVLVLKVSSLLLILESEYRPEMLLFLLDDFLTDLDSKVAHALLKMLTSLKVQLFITSPGSTCVVEDALNAEKIGYQEIIL